MPASVTFTCIQGALQGERFVYVDRASFLVGRAEDCVIRIPRTEETLEVSRHHCLVEVSPPLARIRDFGSLNGTFVNEQRIGARDPAQQAAEAQADAPQRDLVHGDRIRLANVVLEVAVHAPAVCDECFEEIPEERRDAAMADAKRFVCDACRAKEQARRKQEEQQRQQEQERERRRRQAQENRRKEAEKVEALRRKKQEEEDARRKAEEQARREQEEQEARKRMQSLERRAARPPQQEKPKQVARPVQMPKPAAKPAQPKAPAAGQDPLDLIRRILEQARQGDPQVQNVKGYSILETLGKGGMGAVYLARKDDTGQQVALKVMLPQIAANKDAVARFRREMDNATALRHENIVEAYETGYAGGVFYLTMQVCNGGSVQDLLAKSGGRLPLDQAATIIRQALAGLEYMHQAPIPHVRLANGRYGQGRGLVHRDIKPANIFLHEQNGTRSAKIADLGLAKAFDQAGLSGLTMTGQAAGSPPFMPRQQVVDYLHAQPEVDVWAIAATFYVLLTGAAPRTFQPGKDVWLAILQSDAVPIRQRNPAVPQKLAQVLDQALRDRPDIGFSSISELRRALEGAL